MEIYIARHGESQGNLTRIHMLGTDPLSEKGLQQAELLSQRLGQIPIDLILSSSFTRAKQTAEAVSAKIGSPVITSDLLIEAKRPSEIEGRKMDVPETTKIRTLIRENYHNPEFRFSDEETFGDLQKRANRAIALIKKHKTKKVLIISHGDFIRMLVFTMIFKEGLTSQLYQTLRNLDLANTGMIHLVEANSKWKIMTWNDHSHL